VAPVPSGANGGEWAICRAPFMLWQEYGPHVLDGPGGDEALTCSIAGGGGKAWFFCREIAPKCGWVLGGGRRWAGILANST